jgi:hypothetical protein
MHTWTTDFPNLTTKSLFPLETKLSRKSDQIKDKFFWSLDTQDFDDFSVSYYQFMLSCHLILWFLDNP